MGESGEVSAWRDRHAGQCANVFGQLAADLRWETCRVSGKRGKSHSPAQRRPSGQRSKQHAAATANHDRRLAHQLARAGLRFGGGISCCRPCWFARHSTATGQSAQRGDRGVQTSLPNSISAWLNRPAPRRGSTSLGRRPQKPLAFAAVRVAGVGQQPAQDPQGVGFEDRLAGVEGDREDRPGRIAADARQAAHDCGIAGELAAMLGHDDLGGLVQLPRTAIIAQPFPQAQHLVLVGPGKRLDRGKPMPEIARSTA